MTVPLISPITPANPHQSRSLNLSSGLITISTIIQKVIETIMIMMVVMITGVLIIAEL
jgi:hypothetical protein